MKFNPGKKKKTNQQGLFIEGKFCLPLSASLTSLRDGGCWEASGRKEGDFSSEKS